MLAERGLAPRHRLGQNFLLDPALLQATVRDADVRPGERVLEVGPGAGALTAELLAAGAALLAVEVDRGLAVWLRERFAAALAGEPGSSGSLQLVEGDVLAPGERLIEPVESWWAGGSPPKVVANLPYGISGPFLGRLPGRPLAGANLLLQAEVAEKAAASGGEAYGPLSVRLGLAFEVRVGRRVPPEVFWPRPRVESAFLQLEPRPDAPGREEDEALARLLRLGFGQRRKQLLARLRGEWPRAAEALEACGVAERARPAEVPPGAWRRAAQALILQDSQGE